MELITALLGVWMLYSTGHFFVIQNKNGWNKRTQYERVVTVSAITSIILVYLGVMFP